MGASIHFVESFFSKSGWHTESWVNEGILYDGVLVLPRKAESPSVHHKGHGAMAK